MYIISFLLLQHLLEKKKSQKHRQTNIYSKEKDKEKYRIIL